MKNFAKFAMVGVIGIVMLAGSGVMAGITASPVKATVLGGDIKVTITKPEGAIFDSASWTGPNGLEGTLNGPDVSDGTNPEGVTMVNASEYSVYLDDYVFTVKWKKEGEKPFLIETAKITELSANVNGGAANGKEKPAKATLYKHWNVQLHGVLITKKKGSRWFFNILGQASPIGLLINGTVTVGGIPMKDKKKLAGNLYRLTIPRFENLNPPLPLKVSAVSTVDGVLPRKGNKFVKMPKVKIPMI